MPQYISTFTTGFEEIAARRLACDLDGARLTAAYNGLLHYDYEGGRDTVLRLPFVNNTFELVKAFPDGGPTFERMAAKVASMDFQAHGQIGSFRVRFSRENRFESVPGKLAAAVERTIIKNTGLKPDRLNSDTEFWFIIRSEGAGFFGRLLKKRAKTEKTLHRGELRPELAYLLCCCAEPVPDAVVCDPFAGYGAIPMQLQKYFKYAKMYLNDIDGECAAHLNNTSLGKDPKVVITNIDALRLGHIADASVDLVVTDPPWGVFGKIDDIAVFYHRVMSELRRILACSGRIVLLTGKPAEMLEALQRAALRVSLSFSTLVNGKKANVMIVEKA